MLNVCLICWLMNVFVGSTWLQHRVLVPEKHGVHSPVLERIMNFLTLPFSIRVLPIISFRFLFPLKDVSGCSWNNSNRFLLVWRMFQLFQTTAVRFGSCCSWSFTCSRLPYASLSNFSNCSSTSFWS